MSPAETFYWRDGLPIAYEPEKAYPYRDFELIEFIKLVEEKSGGTVVGLGIDRESHSIMVYTN